MKTILFWTAAMLTAAGLLAGPGHGAKFSSDYSTLRCPGGIVSLNMDAYAVADTCGEPFRTYDSDGYEVWVYHFGQGRLVYYLRFSRDNLHRIQGRRCDIDNRDCVYLGR